MRRLVLASTSPYRRQLLERLRIRFTSERPEVDEQAVKKGGGDPLAVATELARRKALAVQARCPDAVVIGSDQVATIDGRILDKPGTAEAAKAQLQLLAGRRHALLTAVAIALDDRVIAFHDVTWLCMRALTTAEIDRYVAADSPLDCAGSYKIEALGIALFAAIDGEDQTAITGLPLLRLAAELRQIGFDVP